MGPADSIRKIGFRRWYERQLIEGHLYLVTAVLALILFASGFELFSMRENAADFLVNGSLVMAGAGIAWFAWRRYAAAMILAEWVGEQAVCPGCQRQGFRPVPVAELPAEFIGTPRGQVVACCRRCGRHWRIDPGKT